MELTSLYDVISVAKRSRLIFRTKQEYRRVLGVTLETIRKKRDSERDMEYYYDALNDAMELPIGDTSLARIVMDYVNASDFYLNHDWGDRRQAASRRCFCHLLFLLAATGGQHTVVGGRDEYLRREADVQLLAELFPEGIKEAPTVSVSFLLLFAFDIISPWDTTKSRGHDFSDKEMIESLRKLRRLIELLRSDLPRLGPTEKPLIFYEMLSDLTKWIDGSEEFPEFSPAWMASMLTGLLNTCRALSVPDEFIKQSEDVDAWILPGIWIDDADAGDSRFWIFPDNRLEIFCYQRNGATWELSLYDSRILRAKDETYYDCFVLAHPKDNRESTLRPENTISNEGLIRGYYETEYDEATDEPVKITLKQASLPFPHWLNWRAWERLDENSQQYKDFRSVLTNIYNPESADSMLFENKSADLSDIANHLVGRDNRYLYVYDYRPLGFRMSELKDEPGAFVYEASNGEDWSKKAIFELELSDAHPLYAIPLKPREFQGISALKTLADIMADADHIHRVYIVHSNSTEYPHLVFQEHQKSIALTPTLLETFGIRKLTQPLAP